MVKRCPQIKACVALCGAALMFLSFKVTPAAAQTVVGGCEAPAPKLQKGRLLKPKEKLRYNIKFMGLTRGFVSFKTRPTKGKFWIKAQGRLKIDGFFHWLDEIDGRMVSYVNPKTGKPGRMFNSVLGGETGEIRESAIFQGEEEVKGTLLHRGRKRPASLKATTEVVDALSALYYLRHRKLTQDRPFCFETYHRRRLWRVEGVMSARKKVSLSAGKFKAVLLEATVRRLGGGKAQGKKYPVKLWLGDDEHRLPLKFETPIGFGDLHVELAEYKLSP